MSMLQELLHPSLTLPSSIEAPLRSPEAIFSSSRLN